MLEKGEWAYRQIAAQELRLPEHDHPSENVERQQREKVRKKKNNKSEDGGGGGVPSVIYSKGEDNKG